MDSLRSFLSDEIKITEVIDATAGAAGAADIEGTTIDMAGFDGVLYLVQFGAITAGAVTSVEARQGALANGSDAAALEGTKQTVADDDDDQIFAIDVIGIGERYSTLHVDRATQNAVVRTALAIQYHARSKPTAFAVADLVNLEQHAAPIEGTA